MKIEATLVREGGSWELRVRMKRERCIQYASKDEVPDDFWKLSWLSSGFNWLSNQRENLLVQKIFVCCMVISLRQIYIGALWGMEGWSSGPSCLLFLTYYLLLQAFASLLLPLLPLDHRVNTSFIPCRSGPLEQTYTLVPVWWGWFYPIIVVDFGVAVDR